MERTAITGISIVSPLGNKADDVFNKLLNGETAYQKIQFLAKLEGKERFGYVFNDLEREKYKLYSWIKEACQQVYQDALLDLHDQKNLPDTWFGAINPFLQPLQAQQLTEWLKLYPGAKKQAVLVHNACASGNIAIGLAKDLISRQIHKRIIVFGGNEINEKIYQGFNSLRLLSDRPLAPFCGKRNGTSLGEGAAAIMLEAESLAIKRKARIYGYVKGWSSTLDGYSNTGFSKNAFGPTAALGQALHNAKLNPGEIDWICAHGSGTIQNDLTETKAIKNIYKEAAYGIPVTSQKGQLGHWLEGAGLINTLIAMMAFKYQQVPGTYNYQQKDNYCDLNYLPNSSQEKKIKLILSNAYGFGGSCSSVIFEKGETYV
jgi:3-oxoacyl-[acyl-carrier-protein] synthase II